MHSPTMGLPNLGFAIFIFSKSVLFITAISLGLPAPQLPKVSYDLNALSSDESTLAPLTPVSDSQVDEQQAKSSTPQGFNQLLLFYSNSLKDSNKLPPLDITPESEEIEKTSTADGTPATDDPNERTVINTARKSGRQRKATDFFKPAQKVIDR